MFTVLSIDVYRRLRVIIIVNGSDILTERFGSGLV